jgi:hypothetical protein
MNELISNMRLLYKHYRVTSGILKSVFKDTLPVETSEKIIVDRIKCRERNFLEVLEKAIFAFSGSPYKVLLERAGYDYGAVRRLVEDRGIEQALMKLYEDGVYIDILEFKGKKETVRGRDIFRFQEKDFSNPLLIEGLRTKTGGTRSAGTNIVVPFEYIKEHNPYGVVASHYYGISENPVVIWLSILPAGDGLFFSLRFAAMGNPPVKWFSPVDEKYIRPSLMDKFKTKSAIWLGALHGRRMPAPEFVDMRRSFQIARWMSENLGNSKGFTVVAYPSLALRLILEARKENLDLGETVFWLMAEPLTDKIRDEIEASGCKAYSLFGCNELMIIGHGCANPDGPDDMHLLEDKLAAIQCKRNMKHSDITVDSLLFTTLLKSSPKIFLNTETGDYGTIEERACGCGFEKLGLSRHIHTIRSFEKLTAEGSTFLGSDLIPLVQETLPLEFGGNANDYQFMEEPDDKGIHRFYMLISPEIGEVDEDRVKKIVLDALTTGEYAHAYSRSYWEQAETLRIQRQHPIPTKRGKIYPLHIRQGMTKLSPQVSGKGE